MRYLQVVHVLAIYARLFRCTLEQVLDFVMNRNPGAIDGALKRAKSYAIYENADIALQAAVIAHGLVQGHYFKDGNKRTALESPWLFLQFNDFALSASQDERFRWMVSLTEDRPDGELIDELTERIRLALSPLISEITL